MTVKACVLIIAVLGLGTPTVSAFKDAEFKVCTCILLSKNAIKPACQSDTSSCSLLHHGRVEKHGEVDFNHQLRST